MLFLTLAVAASVAAMIPSRVTAATGVAPCVAGNLTLRVADDDGQVSGMSHTGVRAIVENAGAATCTVPPFPVLTMRDARGSVIAAAVAGPPYGGRNLSHFAVFPAVLARGATASGNLRWIDGNVFDASAHEGEVTSLAFEIGGGVVTAPMRATIWAAAGKPLVFSEWPFAVNAPR